MKSKLTSIHTLYAFAHRIWRRHHKLIIALAVTSHSLVIFGWIMLVPPDNVRVEAIMVFLISSWFLYPAKLMRRKRWRVVIPFWIATGLILMRTNNFDIVAGVFMLGALGLIAFIN